MHTVNRPMMYAVLFAAILLQFTVARYFAFGGVKPDLVIICVIFFGLYFGSHRGFEAGLVAGFLQDVFVLDYFGVNALLYAATGMYAGAISKQFSRESGTVRFFLVMFVCALSMTAHFTLAAVLSPYHALGLADYVTGTVVPGSVLTALFSALTFPWLVRFFGVKEAEVLV